MITIIHDPEKHDAPVNTWLIILFESIIAIVVYLIIAIAAVMWMR